MAKFTLPKTGWAGVFAIAIVFDLCAATLSYFVLRRMKVPSLPPVVDVRLQTKPSVMPATH